MVGGPCGAVQGLGRTLAVGVGRRLGEAAWAAAAASVGAAAQEASAAMKPAGNNSGDSRSVASSAKEQEQTRGSWQRGNKN